MKKRNSNPLCGKKAENQVFVIIWNTIKKSGALSVGVLFTVVGAIVISLLPPLVLEKIINLLTGKKEVGFFFILLYFGLIAGAGILEGGREGLLTIFGQRITHGLRSALSEKLSRLPADTFVREEPGVITSRFVGDTDTVEKLFTSGIISMIADFCKVISIFAIIFVKNKGLALLLLLVLPLLFWFTRYVQKRTLKAQIANREAIGRVTNHVPETISCIRTIHTLGKEAYMRKRYDSYIEESYKETEKTNFYDSVYSPIILMINAGMVALVLLLSATGNPKLQSFFGMSVGTAVAVISYISQVFGPLENIGMEIQTIQSAIAGVHRIDEFLSLPDRWDTEETVDFREKDICINLDHVTFGYEEEHEVFRDVSLRVKEGEHITLAGRTGAGKTTIFKLLLGLYQPWKGEVKVYGQEASRIPDGEKRKLFGYVEQNFPLVPGTIEEQITLFDRGITYEQVEKAARTVGLHETIKNLKKGYETICTPELFSQGQWQLLSIARAIAAEPRILLLDEITANLDAQTEELILKALRNASENRTVLSISHRLYEQEGGRLIEI